MRRRPSRPPIDPRYGPPPSRPPSGPPPSSSSVSSLFNRVTLALLGAVFVIGIGVGVVFSSTTTLSDSNVASQAYIDQSAPNPEVCVQFGASAVVADMRFFLTLNPFSVYVSRPTMEPGCVLRRNNWALLERRNLVSDQEVNDCRRKMNTFGFTGDLEKGEPKISCIYQNDSAQNLFLRQPPGGSPLPSETESF